MKTASIGIFDSGFGGLTVMHAIKNLLPNENITYFADTKNLPYGSKSPENILKHSLESIQFLNSQGIKLLVVACHTSSLVSIPRLQEHFTFPIVSISSAAIKDLRSQKKANHIAILGTEATINSQAYQQTIQNTFPFCQISAVSCPRFVPLIEMGYIDTPLITRSVIRESLDQLINTKKPIDSALLACTHYPLLIKAIQNELGLETLLIDPSKSCALEVKQILTQCNLNNDSNEPPQTKFFVSSNPEKFQTIGGIFSQLPLAPVLIPQSASFL